MANLNFLPRQLSTTERVKAELRAATQEVMTWLAFDEHGCNGVVAAGKTYWREQCIKCFEDIGVPCNQDIADRIFAFACHMVRVRYRAEQSAMGTQDIAKLAMDATEEIAPALSPEDVIDSLEIDSSGTSDDARRTLYGRDGSAEQHFEQIKDAMKRRLRGGDDPFSVKPEDVH